MAKHTTDPLRARLLEMITALTEHAGQLRDYASVPGNAWLAKSELQDIGQIVSDLETLLEDIKQEDAEQGL